jgi:hypothetical protein
MLTAGGSFIIACHVPDRPLLSVHVPDIVYPSALNVPAEVLVAPSLPTQEKVILRPLTLPVICWFSDVVPERLFSVCVNVKRFGPCSPGVPVVA